jgi:hypothetical protein
MAVIALLTPIVSLFLRARRAKPVALPPSSTSADPTMNPAVREP